MERQRFPLTIDELAAFCKTEQAKGNGKKYVLISDDEEANGYHECYFPFGDAECLKDAYCVVPEDLDLAECMILG